MKKIKKNYMLILLLVILAGLWWLNSSLGNLPDNDKPEITIEYKGLPSQEKRDEESIPDSEYYETVEEAMLNVDIEFEEDREYIKRMENIIASFENENYKSVYYQVYKNEETVSGVLVLFKIKEIDGVKKYTVIRGTPSETDIDSKYEKNLTKGLERYIRIVDLRQGENIAPDSTKMLWGVFPQKNMAKGESIEKLRVNGKKPDIIAEYKKFGETWYFWYYADIGKDTSFEDITYTLGREE